ncbi:YdbC family protein [Halobacillus hunanensis]|uniref:YdbC family protein n=1 Tax=Halobacillus hunanensis TaxID=578214 RepID=UPI0009A6259D|nr:YdbC family protein [Halobacillus hunanensis]
MIIKWIVCKVPENKREEFSYAQTQWKSLRNIEGFLGQIGGWDSQMSSKAGILSFWKEFQSYRAFMENEHDKIFKRNQQANTYSNISVEIYSETVALSGVDIIDSLTLATFVRVASFTAPVTMPNHLEAIQKNLEEGPIYQDVLANVFSKDREKNCLLASLGRGKESLKKWEDSPSNSSKESVDIQETLLQLEKNWLII